MLDLEIFRDRLFGASAAAALINGLSRFALMFLLVFYFQGPQKLDPVQAGLRLSPLAVGMLVASPVAGWIADRRGSRILAAFGMALTAFALAGMTTLDATTPYWVTAVWLGLVGIGSGAFNSPNTAAMMGVVPQHRRGVAAGARTMLQNTGAVISISFVLAIVTAGIPKTALFKNLLGDHDGAAACPGRCVPLQHAPRALGARGRLGRRHRRLAPASVPRARARGRAAPARRGGMSGTATARAYRIGELAALVGTTPRTVRYYEEIGLLPPGPQRAKGAHRTYSDADAERLRDLVRLRDLLGVSLEQLKTLVEAEQARAHLRRRFASTDDEAEKRDIAAKALGHVEQQLALVRERKAALETLEAELLEKQARIRARLAG